MSKRPKYHFLTILVRTDGKTSVTALPDQTFGRNPVPERILVKDAAGSTAVTRARKKGKPGDIFFTTTLKDLGGCLQAKDIFPLEEGDTNIIFSDVRDLYQQYLRSLSD